MGCHIHPHIEIKISGKWEHYSAPDIDRDYELFTRMAGIRRGYGDEDVVPISEPRGLPDDISVVTAIAHNYMGSDAHDMSWLSAAEISTIQKERMLQYPQNGIETFGWLFENNAGSWVDYPQDYPKEIEDVRLVFWFDN